MDCVMINQLPELAIPRNRTFAPSVNNMTVATATSEKRNPYITKWYVLFENKNEQWISFQPKAGHVVYPCYACRDMFGSRNSFLDHINRRGLVCKYKCGTCKQLKTFYNTCSFLLHCREHFSENGGSIDLDFVEISTIPMDMAGFLPIPTVGRLYDTGDDSIDCTLKISAKFFKPMDDCAGKRHVNLISNDLVFFCSAGNILTKDNEALILKQVNKSIPKCLFVPVMSATNNNNNSIVSNNDSSHIGNTSEDESDVICLDQDDEDSHMSIDDVSTKHRPIKIQVKNLHMLQSSDESSCSPGGDSEIIPICPECKSQQRIMSEHFQQISQPIADNFKCKTCGLIATSYCSLSAHLRLHDRKAPHVCPECGMDFVNWNDFEYHLENICFHIAKTVRYKCPAKKCGKVFAQNVTFSSHFPFAHMKVRFACKLCSKYFTNEIEYGVHMQEHGDEKDLPYLRIHECTVCSSPAKDIKKHVLNHVNDKDNRIFVFICRYCRSCYRSKQTYATHILKCTKLLLNNQVKKEVQRSEFQNDVKCKVIKYCKPCRSKIQFNCFYKDIRNVSGCCPKCLAPFSNEITITTKLDTDDEYTSNHFVRRNLDNNSFFCILCSKILENGDEQAVFERHSCTYKFPVVLLDTLNINQLHSQLENLDIEERQEVSPGSDDSAKRKRKRMFNGSMKNKRNSSEKLNDELSADPEPFTGEYKCKFCDFKSELRKAFHEHIQQHRDISTSYQCMECGECFVVKPSLIKHLQVFHLVEDIDSYIKENECFDREAVRMLEENMRMVPGEVKEPLAENQCRICRELFPDSQKLNKHFRVHGMAFLMKKIIK